MDIPGAGRCKQPMIARTEDIHVVVDARPLMKPPHGYATITASIVAILAEAGFQITLLTHGEIDSRYGIGHDLPVENLGGDGGWRWEQGRVPRYLRAARPQIYFAGGNRGLPLARVPATRFVLGMADMIPWLFPRKYLWDPPRFWWLRREMPAQFISLFRADHIVTISDTSARDIRRFARGKPISVIPIRLPGVAATPATDRQRQFAYLGGMERRKKLEVLLVAFAQFRQTHAEFRLVLIGGNYEALRPCIARMGLESAVEITGFVDEVEKANLLRESSAVVYPSLYEGFGLAIAESLLAGTPVICGRGGAQAEVAGTAALYVDPERPAEIAAAMARVLEPAVRAELMHAREAQIKVLLDPTIARRAVALFRRLAEG